MQHEDTGVDIGRMEGLKDRRDGVHSKDIWRRKVHTGLEAYWDRRGHLQRDSHLRLEKQLLLLAITNHSLWILFSLSLIDWRIAHLDGKRHRCGVAVCGR